MRLNLDYLVEVLWEHLNLIKVFTKKRGQKADLVDGIILRNGANVEAVVSSIFLKINFSYKSRLIIYIVRFSVTRSIVQWYNHSSTLSYGAPVLNSTRNVLVQLM